MIIEVKTDPGYVVRVEHGALSHLEAACADATNIAVVFPNALAPLADRVVNALGKRARGFVIPDAEAGKTAMVLNDLWNQLAQAGFTRSDCVVGVGGGATTDLAGFAAATYLRGIDYVSVPTSVLGAVDAALGGKTGINLRSGKNLVGAFYEPKEVICDLDLLSSLAPNEVLSGLGEIIKCGFIDDPKIISLIQQNPGAATDVSSDVFEHIAGLAIAVKARTVASDLKERTSCGDVIGREALNYGHTLAHAIEANEVFGWRHGFAVAIGMVFAAQVSSRLVGLDDTLVELHKDMNQLVSLPTTYKGHWPTLRKIMSLDKKARGNTLRLVGLKGLGQPCIIDAPSEDVLAASFETLTPPIRSKR